MVRALSPVMPVMTSRSRIKKDPNMINFKASLVASSIIGLLSLSACSQANTNEMLMANAASQSKVPMSSPKSYSKPGPAVDMRSDYPGYSPVGQTQTIHFTFKHGYPDGQLTVSTLPIEGVTVSNAPNGETRRLVDRQDETFEIEFTPNVAAVTPLNILTDIETADGQMMKRSFVIMVNSLSPNVQKVHDAGGPKDTQQVIRKSGETVIIMPVEEEIIDHKKPD